MEASEILEKINENDPFSKESEPELKDSIIDIVKKEVPMVPRYDGYCGFVSYDCPICKREVNREWITCPYCSQSLKWTNT